MAHATKTSGSTLRGIVLVIALVALVFPVAASADTMVTLNEGMLTLQVSFGTSSDLRLTATEGAGGAAGRVADIETLRGGWYRAELAAHPTQPDEGTNEHWRPPVYHRHL